ncbi:MAG: L-histidine N(alpha)-methyltransferase [Planctomycetales bacterium]|nr:L-histidine N(alpha)-methyltransferase [Planctomycetales bacterium]
MSNCAKTQKQQPHTLLDGGETSSEGVYRNQFLHDVWQGLSCADKYIHCKYLYDDHGSVLFDKISQLDEYYPTRTELEILATNASAMSHCVGQNAVIVELGSGSSHKTRLLLDHLLAPTAYLPVDISREHLLRTARLLAAEYPTLKVEPIVADFTSRFEIPSPYADQNIVVYFPGSTIGNLTIPEAMNLLHSVVNLEPAGIGLLIGIDLVKDKDVLERAYNDSEGISARFNLNLLTRANRELDANFDLRFFKHIAFYNEKHSRIEIYLESSRDQKVSVGSRCFDFRAGERIHTEYSHKYTLPQFSEMARTAGLETVEYWTDPQQYFAVMYLTAH